MKLSNRGFSMLEILAVLAISTILLVPLMSSFSNSIKLNEMSHAQRSSTSIADGTLYGIEKIDFSEFRTLLNTANTNNDFYIEINEDNCSTLLDTVNQSLCTQIFDTIWNNLTFDSTTFKVYMYDYILTTEKYNSITTNGSIKKQVRDSILNDTEIVPDDISADIPTLIRVAVWLDFYDEPDLYVTLPGLIVDE